MFRKFVVAEHIQIDFNNYFTMRSTKTIFERAIRRLVTSEEADNISNIDINFNYKGKSGLGLFKQLMKHERKFVKNNMSCAEAKHHAPKSNLISPATGYAYLVTESGKDVNVKCVSEI